MHWIAPSATNSDNHILEKRLWEAADQLRANSGLTSAQYSAPVLGLIFLRFADVRFAKRRTTLEKQASGSRRGSRLDDPGAYHAEGVLYLTPSARYGWLLEFPEGGRNGKTIGAAVNEAMRDIEKHNPQLGSVLPKTYEIFDSKLLKEILKRLSEIPANVDYDTFGRVYEYFLGEFARTEGQKGGEFYTPASIVRFMVEVIEPFHGRILDPACGSGGMFVQSARFVAEHKKNPASELAIHGQEKVEATVNLCRMNLAVHGLEGDIKKAISYYEDLHASIGKFDFVLANPPFNVDAVDKDRLKNEVGPGKRYSFGLPRTDNGNYLWIQLFYSALNAKGRAGFVMANSASDARSSEMEIRKQLIQSGAVDVIVAVGPNMFYTVTLPCTLWFFDKAKVAALPAGRAGVGTGTGLALYARSPNLTAIGCAVGLIATSANILQTHLAKGGGEKAYEALLKTSSENLVTAKLVKSEIEALLPCVDVPKIQKRLLELWRIANHTARSLNKTYLPLATLDL